MKLVHRFLPHPIIIEENKVNVIVIENQDMLSEIISEVIDEISCKSGNFVLSDDDGRIDFSKTAEIITDVFSLDINDKKFLSKLFTELKAESSNERFYIKTMELNSAISSYLTALTDLEGFNVIHEEEGDLSNIFKAFDLRFADEAVSLSEKIIEYIGVCSEFAGKNIFIFVNLKSFVSEEDLEKIYEFSFYKKINLILFESHADDSPNEYDFVRIIDRDLCEVC